MENARNPLQYSEEELVGVCQQIAYTFTLDGPVFTVAVMSIQFLIKLINRQYRDKGLAIPVNVLIGIQGIVNTATGRNQRHLVEALIPYM
jgi:hypothetical protein